MVLAIKLAQRRKRDVIDVEIETHANSIGGDQEFDIARLVESDLSIARARRQCTQNNSGTTALAAD